MAYYHSLITDKSWQILKALAGKYRFILIGGWAVFLWTRTLKSKDIDIVLEFDELEKIRNDFEINKNDRLKKYEIKKEGIDIDIYVPFYSNPGLPAEDLQKYQIKLEGFTTLTLEALFILKLGAARARLNSPKGQKDLIDLVSLLMVSGFNWKKCEELFRKYDLLDLKDFLIELLRATKEIPELELNTHKMASFKKKTLAKVI